MTYKFKIGDKVRCLSDAGYPEHLTAGATYIVKEASGALVKVTCDPGRDFLASSRLFELVDSPPKPWRDMTDEERAPILLAWARGETIQVQPIGGVWEDLVTPGPLLWRGSCYRIKPKPVVEVAEMHIHESGGEFFMCGPRATNPQYVIKCTKTGGKLTKVELVE